MRAAGPPVNIPFQNFYFGSHWGIFMQILRCQPGAGNCAWGICFDQIVKNLTKPLQNHSRAKFLKKINLKKVKLKPNILNFFLKVKD
jgi:hypothetical protein